MCMGVGGFGQWHCLWVGLGWIIEGGWKAGLLIELDVFFIFFVGVGLWGKGGYDGVGVGVGVGTAGLHTRRFMLVKSRSALFVQAVFSSTT